MFFSDYGKISLVLGKSFIEARQQDASEVFAANDYDQLLADELSGQKTYQIRYLKTGTSLRFMPDHVEADPGF